MKNSSKLEVDFRQWFTYRDFIQSQITNKSIAWLSNQNWLFLSIITLFASYKKLVAQIKLQILDQTWKLNEYNRMSWKITDFKSVKKRKNANTFLVHLLMKKEEKETFRCAENVFMLSSNGAQWCSKRISRVIPIGVINKSTRFRFHSFSSA